MVNVLIVVGAYLAGSLCFGIIVSHLKGWEIRDADVPGGSGVFRQMGPYWGALVTALDVLKGVLVGLLAAHGTQLWVVPLAALGVVAGHNWPVYFGFRGGGGIAPSVGVFACLFPIPTLIAVVIGLAAALAYDALYWRGHRSAIYPFPFGAIFGYAALLVGLRGALSGVWAVTLVSLAALLRGVHMLKPPHPRSDRRSGHQGGGPP